MFLIITEKKKKKPNKTLPHTVKIFWQILKSYICWEAFNSLQWDTDWAFYLLPAADAALA